MIEREKVIQGLQCCAIKKNCFGCPYNKGDNTCMDDKDKDALKLLKEHVEIILCKDCKYGELDTEHFVRPSIVCKNPANGVGHVSHRPGWFCADGERKEGR